jgi:hypothetical protein
MWAAGSGGTIAVSTDAGEHWQKQHEDPSDGLLLSLAFVNDKFGYAGGTGAHVLFTKDGGETWTEAITAPGTVLQAAFGDTAHGVIRTRDALLSTTDGGKTWKPVSPAKDPTWQQKYPYTTSMAALDGAHLIVRVSGGQAEDGEFLFTPDGGDTWIPNYLPNGAGSGSLFTVAREYWSIGIEVINKNRPGGGYSVPMAVRSHYGAQWQHVPEFREACHRTGCGGCTQQGCFAGRTSFVPFSRILEPSETNKPPVEPLEYFPEHVLSNNWARIDGTLCLLTHGTIDCTTLAPTTTVDAKDDQAEWDDALFPPVVSPSGSGLNDVHCIRCELPRIFLASKGKSGLSEIQLHFTVQPNGRAGNLVVSGVPDEVSARIRSITEGWLFDPPLQNGKPAPIDITMHGKVLVMTPNGP